MPATINYSSYDEQPDFLIEKYTFKLPLPLMHYHHSYELYYILNGARDYFIGDQFLSATEGEFVLVPKEELHRTAGKGASRILIYFSDRFLEQYFSKEIIAELLSDYQAKVFTPDPVTQKRMVSAMTAMLTEYEQKERPINLTKCAEYLFELLFLLHTTENQHVAPQEKNIKFSQIIKYINEHFAEIKTIEDVASTFYISPSYLSRLFRRELGVPLFTYLNTVKIREACLLLRDEKQRITDVSLNCGFNTSSYFCKVFESHMKMSPREYQKQFASDKA